MLHIWRFDHRPPRMANGCLASTSQGTRYDLATKAIAPSMAVANAAPLTRPMSIFSSDRPTLTCRDILRGSPPCLQRGFGLADSAPKRKHTNIEDTAWCHESEVWIWPYIWCQTLAIVLQNTQIWSKLPPKSKSYVNATTTFDTNSSVNQQCTRMKMATIITDATLLAAHLTNTTCTTTMTYQV